MSRFLKGLSLLLVVVALTGCFRTKPIYNIDQEPVPVSSKKLSSSKVCSLIRETAKANKWLIKKVSSNRLRGIMRWREHKAEINIVCSNKHYSITYAGSQNLLAKDGMIHNRYNKFVQKLDNEIQRTLFEAAHY